MRRESGNRPNPPVIEQNNHTGENGIGEDAQSHGLDPTQPIPKETEEKSSGSGTEQKLP